MKTLKQLIITTIFALALLLGIVFTTTSCSSDNKKAKTEKATEAVIYTCPMHPEIKQSEPGQCPICGMDLVKASELKK